MPSLRSESRTATPVNGTPPPPREIEPPKIEHPQEKGQMGLTSWVEPDPRAAIPSFEDHGLSRGGVVLNMVRLTTIRFPPNNSGSQVNSNRSELFQVRSSESNLRTTVRSPACLGRTISGKTKKHLKAHHFLNLPFPSPHFLTQHFCTRPLN
jgi:hypothetical protein